MVVVTSPQGAHDVLSSSDVDRAPAQRGTRSRLGDDLVAVHPHRGRVVGHDERDPRLELVRVHLTQHGLGGLRALVERTGIDPAAVDDVVFGCLDTIGGQAGNVARTAVLAAGWPETVPGTTVTRACGSSQQAVSMAAAVVISGQQDIVIAGGGLVGLALRAWPVPGEAPDMAQPA